MVSKDFKEIFTVEFISITGGLLAGAILAAAKNQFLLIPGLLIFLPGFLEMRGSISGSLSARLSSGLWLHALEPRIHHNRILRGNVIASFLLVVVTSLLLGAIAYFASYFIFGISSMQIILVALIAGVLSNIIEIPTTILLTFWLFRKGHDPNNVMGPYVTTSGDIVSVVSLLLAILVV